MTKRTTALALSLITLAAPACSDEAAMNMGASSGACADTSSTSSSTSSSSSSSGASSTTGTGGGEGPITEAQYTGNNYLLRPQDYREWIYVSSGIGMSYNPDIPIGDAPPFDNVFVPPAAYRTFKQTGSWPDKTIFVLEVRASTDHGSILKQGKYQTNVVSIEAEVKDASRFTNTWAYFNFTQPDGTLADVASAQPKDGCFACHNANAAVEQSFVQFYPTLFAIAEAKGTLRPDYPK